jgi:hypothetical protein
MKPLAILIPLGVVGFLLVATTFRAPPRTEVEGAQEVSIRAPDTVVATIPLARLPTAEAAGSMETPTPTPTAPPMPTRVAATLPTRAPASLPARPAAILPERSPAAVARGNCDPAYPEQRTCIPPGPPFNQGCAITDQRLFVVLTPDPQRLDADRDGIGCEPIAASP